MSDTKVTAWIPQHEAEALKKLRSEMTYEQWRQQSYFFWNNFSMEGYEDWKNKDEEKAISE